MFIHNINPVLLQLGPLQIRYYSLVYIIGFLLIYYIIHKKRAELNLEKNDVENLILYLMIGVIVGSRAGHVIGNLGYYLANPLKILAVWEGGMAFFGGLVGVVLTAWLFTRKKDINFAKLADIVIIPVVFVLALGRIANFINGELWGTVTNVSWCVNFPGAEGCRHPAQIYAAIKRTLVGFILIGITYLKPNAKDGFLFWCFALLFGIGRFIVDFFRQDPRLFGLSFGQYFGLILFLIAGYVLWKYYRKSLSL